MFSMDAFWEELVERGLIGPDQAGRARIRHAEMGGGFDTAVVETTALDAEQTEELIEVAARALSLPVAPIEFIDAPDLEALARVPRKLVTDVGVLTSRELNGRPVAVIPPLAKHLVEDIRTKLGGQMKLYVASEADIRHALQRFAGLGLPKRFEDLWTGLCPAVMDETGWTACGPIPVPRSTSICDLGTEMDGPDGYRETDDYAVVGIGPAETRPGRPSALGVAETGEFGQIRPEAMRSAPPERIVRPDTFDDPTAVFYPDEDDIYSSVDELSESGDLGSVDTIPPAGQ